MSKQKVIGYLVRHGENVCGRYRSETSDALLLSWTEIVPLNIAEKIAERIGKGSKLVALVDVPAKKARKKCSRT